MKDEARVPVTDDALVAAIAEAMRPVLERDGEIYWAAEYGRPTPDASLAALARAAIAIAYPAGVVAGREEAAKTVEAWDKIGWSRMDLIDLRMHLAAAIRERGK